jgi:hypothetical protein
MNKNEKIEKNVVKKRKTSSETKNKKIKPDHKRSKGIKEQKKATLTKPKQTKSKRKMDTKSSRNFEVELQELDIDLPNFHSRIFAYTYVHLTSLLSNESHKELYDEIETNTTLRVIFANCLSTMCRKRSSNLLPSQLKNVSWIKVDSETEKLYGLWFFSLAIPCKDSKHCRRCHDFDSAKWYRATSKTNRKNGHESQTSSETKEGKQKKDVALVYFENFEHFLFPSDKPKNIKKSKAEKKDCTKKTVKKSGIYFEEEHYVVCQSQPLQCALVDVLENFPVADALQGIPFESTKMIESMSQYCAKWTSTKLQTRHVVSQFVVAQMTRQYDIELGKKWWNPTGYMAKSIKQIHSLVVDRANLLLISPTFVHERPWIEPKALLLSSQTQDELDHPTHISSNKQEQEEEDDEKGEKEENKVTFFGCEVPDYDKLFDNENGDVENGDGADRKNKKARLTSVERLNVLQEKQMKKMMAALIIEFDDTIREVRISRMSGEHAIDKTKKIQYFDEMDEEDDLQDEKYIDPCEGMLKKSNFRIVNLTREDVQRRDMTMIEAMK